MADYYQSCKCPCKELLNRRWGVEGFAAPISVRIPWARSKFQSQWAQDPSYSRKILAVAPVASSPRSRWYFTSIIHYRFGSLVLYQDVIHHELACGAVLCKFSRSVELHCPPCWSQGVSFSILMLSGKKQGWLVDQMELLTKNWSISWNSIPLSNRSSIWPPSLTSPRTWQFSQAPRDI